MLSGPHSKSDFYPPISRTQNCRAPSQNGSHPPSDPLGPPGNNSVVVHDLAERPWQHQSEE